MICFLVFKRRKRVATTVQMQVIYGVTYKCSIAWYLKEYDIPNFIHRTLNVEDIFAHIPITYLQSHPYMFSKLWKVFEYHIIQGWSCEKWVCQLTSFNSRVIPCVINTHGECHSTRYDYWDLHRFRLVSVEVGSSPCPSIPFYFCFSIL